MAEKDELKQAMLKYAPELADDYKRFVRKIFRDMTEEVRR